MPEKWISQTDHPRVVIPGHLREGGACTTLLEMVRGQWHLYRLGVPEDPVTLISDADLRRAAQQILGEAA